MAKVTLARAFVVRKRILKDIGLLCAKAQMTKPIYEKGKEDKKVDVDGYIETIVSLRKSLVELNNAIDVANASGPRKIINEIEACKQNISTYSNAAANVSGFEPVKKVWDPYKFNSQTKQLGDYTTIEYVLCGKNAEYWQELEANERDRLLELEDKLAEANASTMVDLPM